MKKSALTLLIALLSLTALTAGAARYKCICYAGNGYFTVTNSNIPAGLDKPQTWYLMKGGKIVPKITSSSLIGVPEIGVASVNRGDLNGLINFQGKTILPFKRRYIMHLGNGLYELIGSNGSQIWNRKTKTTGQFINGYCKGKISEGLIRFEKGLKWGYCNANGKVVISPIYDYALDFSEGHAAVRKGSKWGFINKSGRTVIPFTYEDDESWYDDDGEPPLKFINGITPVRKNGQMGAITKSNKVVVPFSYYETSVDPIRSEIKAFDYSGTDREDTYSLTGKRLRSRSPRHEVAPGLYRKSKGERYGLVNSKGTFVVPAKYDLIMDVDGFIICQSNLFGTHKGKGSVDIYNKAGKLIYKDIAEQYYGFLFG